MAFPLVFFKRGTFEGLKCSSIPTVVFRRESRPIWRERLGPNAGQSDVEVISGGSSRRRSWGYLRNHAATSANCSDCSPLETLADWVGRLHRSRSLSASCRRPERD